MSFSILSQRNEVFKQEEALRVADEIDLVDGMIEHERCQLILALQEVWVRLWRYMALRLDRQRLNAQLREIA